MKHNVYIVGLDGNIISQTNYGDDSIIDTLELQYYRQSNRASLYITNNYGVLTDVLNFDTPIDFKGLSLIPNSNEFILNVGENDIVSAYYGHKGSLILYIVNSELRANSFIIQCYKNTSEFNRVDKTDYLEFVRTYSGTLREQSSLINPVITIEHEGVIDFNYIKIPLFNRYYYVSDVTMIAKNLWQIVFSIDVLMTYKNGIYNQTVFVDRNETYNNPYLIDKKRVIEQGFDLETIIVPNELFVNLNPGEFEAADAEKDADGDLCYILSGYRLNAVAKPR